MKYYYYRESTSTFYINNTEIIARGNCWPSTEIINGEEGKPSSIGQYIPFLREKTEMFVTKQYKDSICY